MQHCTATVRIGADLNFAVFKGNITVPEIVLLRILHGDDAVVDIRPLGESKRTLRGERDRLLVVYGIKPEHVEKIHGMFANLAIQGLNTLADVGVDPKTKPLPRPKLTDRMSAAEDVRPYDPTLDDIVLSPEGDDEDELIAPVAADELAPEVSAAPASPVEPERDLTDDELAELAAEGAAAARKSKPRGK